jgi:hypothetical protein
MSLASACCNIRTAQQFINSLVKVEVGKVTLKSNADEALNDDFI